MMCNPPPPRKQKKKSPWRAIIGFISYVCSAPVVLMLSAGRMDWWAAWALVALNLAFMIGGRVIAFRKHPDLMQERASATQADDAKRWDKIIVPISVLYLPLVGWAVAGLHDRFAWRPQITPGIQLAALAVILAANTFSTWAIVENRFFSAVVRIQKDRGHRVISSGPYCATSGLCRWDCDDAGDARSVEFSLGVNPSRAWGSPAGGAHRPGGQNAAGRTARVQGVYAEDALPAAARSVVERVNLASRTMCGWQESCFPLPLIRMKSPRGW